MTKHKRLLRTEQSVLREAEMAFSDMDAFVAELDVQLEDNGASAIRRIGEELDRRVVAHPDNAVIRSTCAGLAEAYRLVILQRVLDSRLGTRRTAARDITSRKNLKQQPDK
jgi:hypothetical protein